MGILSKVKAVVKKVVEKVKSVITPKKAPSPAVKGPTTPIPKAAPSLGTYKPQTFQETAAKIPAAKTPAPMTTKAAPTPIAAAGMTETSVARQSAQLAQQAQLTQPSLSPFQQPAPQMSDAQFQQEVSKGSIAAREAAFNKLAAADPGRYGGGAVPITASDIASFAGGAFGFVKAFAVKSAASLAAQSAMQGTGKILMAKTAQGVIVNAGGIAANPVNTALTASWLSKAAGAASNPAVVISGVMAAIGSYPFAGFIKEEALQTTGFATESALKAKDLNGIQESMNLQKEILNPSLWNTILSAVPFANVLTKLKDFYKAAAQKLEVDADRFEKLKEEMIDKELEEKPEDKWEAIETEREERKAKETEEEEKRYKTIEENRAEAKREERTEDEEYWRKIQEENAKAREERRKENEEYWKRVKKEKEESQKSKLAFGLLK